MNEENVYILAIILGNFFALKLNKPVTVFQVLFGVHPSVSKHAWS